MHFVIRASAMDMHICTHCTPIYRYVGITCLFLMCYYYSTIIIWYSICIGRVLDLFCIY